jgi:hypothetical protein
MPLPVRCNRPVRLAGMGMQRAGGFFLMTNLWQQLKAGRKKVQVRRHQGCEFEI